MSDISDAALLAALRQHLTMAATRQVVAAGNLANANTPGYRAQEADFGATLDASLSQVLKSTDPRHLQPEGGAPPTKAVEGLAERRDGNTVQIDRELLEMTKASGAFQRAQTALSAKFRLVRYAISEGR